MAQSSRLLTHGIIVAGLLLLSNGCTPNHEAIVKHVRATAARGDWTDLTNDFPVAVSLLHDNEINDLLHAIIPDAAKAGKRMVIDQCAAAILFSPHATNNPLSVALAARIWGENAMATDKSAFPSRLETMLRAKVPAEDLCELYNRHYYAFTEQPALFKKLIAFGDRLAPLIKNSDLRNEVKIKVLDGCFLTQDYDRALALLEASIPGADRTEEWHATAIAKVKAHRALQRNEPREAVKYFREFMGQLRKSKDANIADPVTGLLFPKAMVLGRNAKRIGDILAGIPDPAEAAKAYAEARNLYAQALQETTNAEAAKVINAEMAQLPKAD